jgi:hypothetical protein
MGQGDGDAHVLDTGGNLNGPQIKLEEIELEDKQSSGIDNPQEPDFKVESGKIRDAEYEEVGRMSSR